MPAGSQPPPLDLVVDGVAVTVPDEGWTLLDVLRDRLGATSVKDGCSPQGQCGCCTVLVDGAPRVACVTPVRRVAGRAITTFDGLPAAEADGWAEAFCAAGASQCGFCTPGIVVRLSALRARGAAPDDEVAVGKALLAHLCRCTGWRTIFDAWRDVGRGSGRAISPRQPAGRGSRDGRRSAPVPTWPRVEAGSQPTRPRPARWWRCRLVTGTRLPSRWPRPAGSPARCRAGARPLP